MIDHTAKNGHSVISISENESAYLEELNVSHKSLTQNTRNLRLVESEIEMIFAAKESAIQDMEQFIKHAHEQIDQRRADLMNQIMDQFHTQLNTLLDKQKQIQEDIKMLKKNIMDAKNLTQTGDLNGLKPISERLNSINEKMQSMSSNLHLGENYLAFDSDKGLDGFNKCLYTLGQTYTKGFLPTTIAFRGTEAKAGLKSTITVEVCDHQGDTVPLSSGTLSVQIMDPTDIKLETILSTSSEYIVTFTPQVKGLHQVSGMFLGKQLICKQTHISVSCNNPVLKFGKDGSGNGTFNQPWGIAIDNINNCLYVADSGNKLIQKFTAEGKFLSQFSIAVHNEDRTTCDIALDLDKGLIFCPEMLDIDCTFYDGNNILVFNLEGELQDTLYLSEPWKSFSIAIDQQGDLTLTNPRKKCLFKVDKNGNFLSSMGRVKLPGYIAINEDSSIIMPDEMDNCIYILNPDGTVRHKFGSSGTGKGQLKGPRGVASDGEYILVSEIENNRVQVFNYDGTFVSMIDSSADPLHWPCGLAVTTDGYVYVVDTNHNCIKKYKYRDMSW